MRKLAISSVVAILVVLLSPVGYTDSGFPFILSATIDSTNNLLTISGFNFGANPTVTLGTVPLTVSGTPTNQTIVANFPVANFNPGSYLLKVTFSTRREEPEVGRLGGTVAVFVLSVAASSSSPSCPNGVAATNSFFAAFKDLGFEFFGVSETFSNALPVASAGEQWFAVSFSEGGAAGNSFAPNIYLSLGVESYVFDVYTDGIGTRPNISDCTIDPPTGSSLGLDSIRAVGTTQKCILPATRYFIRVRPVGLNLKCDSYTLVIQNQ